MDINTILTILGIAITAFLGIGAIYLALRYSRQIGLAYVEDTCLALIDDVTQGIGGLEIRFRNSPVSQNIVLLKGLIVNMGKRDILPDMVEKPLRLVLPEGLGWMHCQITDRAKDLKVEVVEVTSNGIEFSFGLLKTQEYFRFDALATVLSDENDTSKARTKAPNMKLREVLQFDYRIADAHRIEKLRLGDFRASTVVPPRQGDAPPRNRIARMFQFSLSVFSSPAIGIVLILVGIVAFFVFSWIRPKGIAYEIVGANDQRIVAWARVKSDEIELYDREGFQSTLSTKEFDDLEKTTVLQPPDVRAPTILCLSYIGLGALLLLIPGFCFVRARKYRQILRLVKPY